jgi:hypothetical protein
MKIAEVKKMKKSLIYLVLAALIGLTACSRGEGGAAGYGAGGGQSLRQGSTSPYHSPIAQDQTYQKLLGLNILLYPPPIDDPKFEPLGVAHWELDASGFTQAMKDSFQGQMGDQAVYEPKVDALQNQPLVAQIQDTIYGGAPVQVGWIYGDNANLDLVEYNGVTVTLVTADNAVIFAGDKANLDTTSWNYDVKNLTAFYIPANTVVAFKPETLRSNPLRVSKATGQLTAVITPVGVGIDPTTPGSGMDQALVAKDRWVFAIPGLSGGYFEGLTGGTKSINPVD